MRPSPNSCRGMLFGLVMLLGCAGPNSATSPPAPIALGSGSGSGSGPPATPPDTGIDPSAMDESVKPCEDFYHFACGGWLKRAEIPADRPQWGRGFSEIDERNEKVLHQILDDAAAGKGDPSDVYSKKIGDFYAACMDEDQIERSSLGELQAELKKLDGVKTVPALARAVAHLHLGAIHPFFAFTSGQDYRDSTQMIGVLHQGGLTLPDRDYYLKDDAKSKQIREQYQEHVAKMLELAGVPAAQVARQAETVVRLEHALAQSSMSRTEMRDPRKRYNRLELKGIVQTAPRFPWQLYFRELGYPEVEHINVTVPAFFKALSELIDKTNLDDLRTYVRWHVIHDAAQRLGKAFVDEEFRLSGKILTGTAELPPRWKRCTRATDRAIGEALAQPFVRLTFGSDGKVRSQEMITQIEAAMRQDLLQLAWMDEATRKQALEKLGAIANKIGFPDKWRNYDALEVTRASYLKNSLAAGAFENRRQLDKIGKPVDKTDWRMTPPTVNAYYRAELNEIVFPAGILQPPFFNRAASLPVNYGAIGMVMGHELTHGFDDQGRKFDANGNLRDWWSPTVGEEFDRRAACVVEQYNGYVAVEDMHLNGKLTLGENIADLGGLKTAYHAWEQGRHAHPQNEAPGQKWSGEQLFFLGAAQAWCTKTRPENARMRAITDPHSPGKFRINGPMSNLSEFAAAFQCKPGDKMVRQNQCVIW